METVSYRNVSKMLLSPEEAAELLSISRTRLYYLLARKVIRSIKEGRARLVPALELEAYIQRRLVEQCSPQLQEVASHAP